MSIRSSAKAIVLLDGKILANRYVRPDGSVYYDLPGGGQRQYESMEEALIREVKEETGYAVSVVRFAALAEEIDTWPAMRERYPDHSHRVLHIFLARLADAPREAPTELDLLMEKTVWLTPEELERVSEFHPPALCEHLKEILEGDGAAWLGTAYI